MSAAPLSTPLAPPLPQGFAASVAITPSIVAAVAARAHPADVVAVLSNGGFGGLHDKLLAALRDRFPDPGTT